MSSTTQVTTFSDLYTDLQNRVREETGVTAIETIAKRFINSALIDLHIGYGEQFPWAERRAVITTHAPYSTGTLVVVQGNSSATGTGTDFAGPNAFSQANVQGGGKMTVSGSSEVYSVASTVTAGGDEVNWSEKYLGEDDSAATYVYFEDEYALASDFLRPIDLRSFSDNHDIELIDRSEFRRRFVRNSNTGRPIVATILDLPFASSTTPVRKVRFHPPPDSTYHIPYTYVTSSLAVSSAGVAQTSLSAATDEPIVPLQYRHLIVLHALVNWYRDRKDDPRSAEVKAEFVDLMSRVTSDVEIGSKRPRIHPRLRPYWNRARRPWTQGLGRYDVNGRFDRMEW